MVVLLGVVIYEAREVGRLNRENRLLLAEKDRVVEKRDDALKRLRRATFSVRRRAPGPHGPFRRAVTGFPDLTAPPHELHK